MLLAQVAAALEAGDTARPTRRPRQLLAEDPWDWRAAWMSGLVALARRATTDDAQSAFNAVYGQVPGELAPKLALAVACERGGEGDVAEGLYVTCARPTPTTSRRRRSAWPGSGAAAVTSPARSRPSTWCPDEPRLHARPDGCARPCWPSPVGGSPRWPEAMTSLDSLTIDPVDRSRFRVEVLESALTIVEAQGADATRLDRRRPRLASRHLRDGLEAAYRELASKPPPARSGSRLVDQANAVRRWTCDDRTRARPAT